MKNQRFTRTIETREIRQPAAVPSASTAVPSALTAAMDYLDYNRLQAFEHVSRCGAQMRALLQSGRNVITAVSAHGQEYATALAYAGMLSQAVSHLDRLYPAEDTPERVILCLQRELALYPAEKITFPGTGDPYQDAYNACTLAGQNKARVKVELAIKVVIAAMDTEPVGQASAATADALEDDQDDESDDDQDDDDYDNYSDHITGGLHDDPDDDQDDD